MASTSLAKMQVPGADGGGAASLLMPKLQYRFRVTFVGFAGQAATDVTKQVVDVTRPQVEFTEIPIEVYNSRIYLAGKPTWQALTLNVRDDATGAVSKLVSNQLQRQFDFQEQVSAGAGSNYKFTTNIEILDGSNGSVAPGILETWQCYGCYIGTANYNNLNYGTNEAVTISLTMRYDNAVLLDAQGSIAGATLGGIAGAITAGTVATSPTPSGQ
jgi:hypothetical protein